MRVGNYLTTLTTPKLEHTKEILNLTTEEEIVFDMLSKRKSITEIAYRLNVSTRTIDRMVKHIKDKMKGIP